MAIATDNDDLVENGGNFAVRRVKITLDNAYATGGYALTNSHLGFATDATISAVVLETPVVDGYLLTWNRATGKLQAWVGDNAAAAAGPFAELANASAALNNKVVYALVFAKGAHR